MSFITKKHLPRRTFLHGMGVTLALPLLDSMVPAQTPLRRTAAQPASRFGAIYIPHGATMDKWTPATTGKGFAFTEILAPLEQFRDRINVVSGLAHPAAGGEDGSAGANHTRAAAAFLTGAHPEKGTQARVGVSVDQIIAQRIGQDTPMPSLELSIEEAVLNCESGFSCAYRNTIAWKSPNSPLPMENNPQVLFEKLFGDGSNDAERRARRQESRSLLDSVMAQVGSLQRDLPPADRGRLTEYLENIREIERRIQKVEQQRTTELVIPDAPVGIPDSFDDHIKLLIDLQVLSYQAEITRVSTFMFARELSNGTYPSSGVRDPFHNLSHHSNDRGNMDRFAILNRYHVSKFAYLLDRLQATPDGDGTLLDHSMMLYGSALADGNEHNHDPLPILLAGGASGQLEGGRHIKAAAHTTMSNLLLSMLDKIGIDMPAFGDSTGKLEILEMRHCPVATLVVVAVTGIVGLAQGPSAGKTSAAKTPWGEPDLQGTWTSEAELSVPFERPREFGTRRELTDQEFTQRLSQTQRQLDSDNSEFDLETADTSNAGQVGSATSPPPHWLERGKTSRRTSLVIDPPDGRVPPLTAEAQQRRPGPVGTFTGGQFSGASFAGPQDLSLWERCISRGLPAAIFPTVYNANTRIVQAPGVVAITYEMIHDTRIIPTDGRAPLAGGLRGYFGDSRGRWEGDTLVVDVTNVSEKNNYRGSRETLHLVERFTRTKSGLRYEVTVDDPRTWTKQWTAALDMTPQPEGMFEYACHEGNNSMRNILSGARAAESKR